VVTPGSGSRWWTCWLGFDRADIRRWRVETGLEEIDVDCAEDTGHACGWDGAAKLLSIFLWRWAENPRRSHRLTIPLAEEARARLVWLGPS
jgi:hypothetical protein